MNGCKARRGKLTGPMSKVAGDITLSLELIDRRMQRKLTAQLEPGD